MDCGRVKWPHRSDLAREPLCKEPWYRLKSGDSTHHCPSPTPKLNGCDLPPSTWTQFSEQEYSYLTVSKRHQSTPYSRNTHRTFRDEPGNIVSRGRQNMSIPIWHAPRISRKFAGVEICSVVLRQQNGSRTGYHPALVQLFSWHHGMHSSWETKQRDSAVVGSFTPVSLFVYGDDQFANLSVPFQNDMPLDIQPGTPEHDGGTASPALWKGGQRGHRCPYITVS